MKYLVCNLKNKLVKDEYLKYISSLKDIACKKAKLVICPSSAFLSLFDGANYYLGTQDFSSFMDRTITGEITAEQLRSLGASYVLIGHSERRECRKEINIDFINKINNAHANKFKIIYCIGETLKEHENNKTLKVLEKQIVEVLNNVLVKNIIIAYEPVWAIGTGKIPQEQEIEKVATFIKKFIMEKYEVKVDVLYGGSINPSNITDLKNISGIDGFLVGGASLDAKNVKEMLKKIESQ